jgi:hypothetical protein
MFKRVGIEEMAKFADKECGKTGPIQSKEKGSIFSPAKAFS